MKNNSNSLNVIIAGTRTFDDYTTLRENCDRILMPLSRDKDITVFSGGARGADTLGERYARERGFNLRRFPADWDRHGKAAGPLRNRQMAAEAQALICFWDGHSRGSQHMINVAKKNNLDVHVIRYAQKGRQTPFPHITTPPLSLNIKNNQTMKTTVTRQTNGRREVFVPISEHIAKQLFNQGRTITVMTEDKNPSNSMATEVSYTKGVEMPHSPTLAQTFSQVIRDFAAHCNDRRAAENYAFSYWFRNQGMIMM